MMRFALRFVWAFVAVGCLASCSEKFVPLACQDCLPGIEFLGMGWDAVLGQTRAQRVVEYTFDHNEQFKNPSSGEVYLVPDQITAVPYTQLDSRLQTSVTYSVREVAESMMASVNLGFELNWGLGAFSASSTAKTADSYLSRREYYSSYVKSMEAVSVYQAALHHPDQLFFSDSFSTAIKSLPAEFNEVAYRRFIDIYGTHYLHGAYFGGYGSMYVGVNALYAQTRSKSEVEAQAAIQFRFLKAGATGNKASGWFLGENQQSSTFHTSLVGGDVSLGTNLTLWNEWIRSFYRFPAPILGSSHFPYTVEPLYNTIANLTIKENMKRAVVDYLRRHPFPPSPPCKEEAYCSPNKCCPLASPVCCPASPSGCASSTEQCEGYIIHIEKRGMWPCSKASCTSTNRTRYMRCDLGGSGWIYDVSCSFAGLCMFSSNKGKSCQFMAGSSCSLPYKLGCHVDATATMYP